MQNRALRGLLLVSTVVCFAAGYHWFTRTDGSAPTPPDLTGEPDKEPGPSNLISTIARAKRATDCAGAGDTWDVGTSTCTPASSYNCFIGGFCSQAAIDFPPAVWGYTNVYEGHTQTTAPALGAGCNVSPGSLLWSDASLLTAILPPILTLHHIFHLISMCQ